jgi:IclR family transcriptional regulator, acetate operon repressor
MDDQIFPGDTKGEPPEWRVPSKDYLRSSGQVQSLSRALKLMSALSHHSQGLTLSETAQLVGLPASTAHRLLSTLQNERFVRYDNDRSKWMVGLQAFRVGQAFAKSRDAAQIGKPQVKRLATQSGETAVIATRERAALGPGAAARAMAAFGRGAADGAELAAVRACGYAVVDEDTSIGLRGIAAAIFDEHGEPLAAIAVSGPSARISGARIAALGAAVCAMAKEITVELGGQAPKGIAAA